MKCFFIHLICTNHGLNAMNNAICIVIENVINEARFSVQTAVCYQIKLKKSILYLAILLVIKNVFFNYLAFDDLATFQRILYLGSIPMKKKFTS